MPALQRPLPLSDRRSAWPTPIRHSIRICRSVAKVEALEHLAGLEVRHNLRWPVSG